MSDLAAIIGLSWVGGCVLLFFILCFYAWLRPRKPEPEFYDPLS